MAMNGPGRGQAHGNWGDKTVDGWSFPAPKKDGDLSNEFGKVLTTIPGGCEWDF